MVQMGDCMSCERGANALNGTFLFGKKILIGWVFILCYLASIDLKVQIFIIDIHVLRIAKADKE